MTTPLRHLVCPRNDERMNSDFFFKYFYAGIVQSNLCWKIHNKYVFRVNIHIFVLKYLVQIQIIQNQLKISEGGKWNSHQMPCVYSSRMVKKSRICPIRIEIIHGRHRVVQIYTWAGLGPCVNLHNSMPAMNYFLIQLSDRVYNVTFPA